MDARKASCPTIVKIWMKIRDKKGGGGREGKKPLSLPLLSDSCLKRGKKKTKNIVAQIYIYMKSLVKYRESHIHNFSGCGEGGAVVLTCNQKFEKKKKKEKKNK